MCPSVGPPPSIMTGIIAGGSAVGWMIPGVGVVLAIIAMVMRRYAPLFQSMQRGTLVFGTVLYVCIFVGLFLVVGVADAWEGTALSWYFSGRDMLTVAGCSTRPLTSAYYTIEMTAAWIRGIGWAAAWGSTAVGLTWRVVRHISGQQPAIGSGN